MLAASDSSLTSALHTLTAYAERLAHQAESWRIQDPAQASSTLQQIYSPHRMSVYGAAHDFRMAFARCSVGQLELASLAFGAEVELEQTWTSEFILISTQLSGHARITTAGAAVDGAQGLIVVDSPDHPVTKRFSRDSRRLHVRIARQQVEALAHRLYGHAPAMPRQWQACVQPGGAAHARWMGVLHLLASYASANGALPMQVALEEMAGLALLTELLPQPEVAAPVWLPRHVRRAEAYMAAHLGEPHTLAQLAEIAGTSIRSLTAGFRQYRDTSPLRWLQEQRLLAIHADLRQATPERTVAGIALQHGMTHLGRFARDYQRRFGVTPSDTLRRR